MFDIEQARRKGISEDAIKIMERVNENNRRRESCAGHEFKRIGFGKYRCKNCGYEATGSYVDGYGDAVRHIKAKEARDNAN